MGADIRDRPFPNSYWVLPGEFLAGEHPYRGAGSPLAMRERLRALMDAGIDCFVDLTMPDEFASYEYELPEGVDYIRRPIHDHSIPERREHMIEIQSDLAHALDTGRRIYLHCHAGIGRTGTVAGCFLIEQGQDGDDALETLNHLWQQCARSRNWPYVPETEDQIDFVRTWVPTLATHLTTTPMRARPSKNASSPPARPIKVRTTELPSFPPTQVATRGLRDRFQGALVGLAVGDALAAGTQGRKAGTFPPVTELLGGGQFELPPGAWTDDTAMALCLTESLLDCNGFDVRDQIERYTRWQKEGYRSATGVCVGITPSTARALGAAQWRRQVFAGSHDPKQLDPEVLSRVAPAVMFAFGSPEEALRLACDAARTTCQAPLALEACQLLAALLYEAFAGEPKDGILQPSSALLDLDSLRPRIAKLLTAEPSDPGRAPRIGGTIIEVLQAALWAFKTTDNFRDGALRAANLGGHSDAISAAYGQLAGAWYGAQAIPVAWRNALAENALITGLADRLLTRTER